jgi:DNA-binding MarR family transcriptional regulator
MYLSVNESLGFALTTTLNTLRKRFNSELKNLDITSEQYAVMKLVLEFGSLMPSKIAEMLSRDRANITRIVNSLEKKGFIKKEKLNEKSYVITLTEKGKKALEGAEEIVINFNKKIKNIISDDDYRCLIEKLSLIRDNF